MGSFVDIIFLTLLVVFIITRLYGVFGSGGSDEKVRVIIKPSDKQSGEGFGVTKIIQNEKDENSPAEVTDFEKLAEPDRSLAKIPGFNKENFLHGACRVFEAVTAAFAKGDLQPVKSLISKKLYDAFGQVINSRKENNMTAEADFICFDKSDIKSVKLLKNSVRIVVEFVSEQINLLKNDKGEVVEGDENFVQKITDVWTFERALNAKTNQWLLVSTKKSA